MSDWYHHNSAIVHTKQAKILGTWNTKTSNFCGQLENIKQEMSVLNINILGVCDTWWAKKVEVYVSETQDQIRRRRTTSRC